MRQAGITSDKPLHAILLAVHGAALEAREVVTTGARGLSEKGERDLIQRVAGLCSQAADRAMARQSRLAAWRSGALVAAGMLLALAGGYWLGLSRPVATDLGPLPREVAEALRMNDLSSAWRACIAQPPQGGRPWCYMPLWQSATPPGR